MLSSLRSNSCRKASCLGGLLSQSFTSAERYNLIRKFFTAQRFCSPIKPEHSYFSPSRHISLSKTSPWLTSSCQTRFVSLTRPSFFTTTPRARSFATKSEGEKSIVEDQNKPPKPPENINPQGREQEGNAHSEGPFPHARDHENYSRFFQRLALSLPHPHRPTREDFLNVATGFWQRMRIRFKWFTVRSFRKWNADDISAFITWFVMSQTLWILVGTCVFW